MIKRLQLNNLNRFTMMYYNSILALPFVLTGIWWSDEMNRLAEFPHLHNGYFQVFTLS